MNSSRDGKEQTETCPLGHKVPYASCRGCDLMGDLADLRSRLQEVEKERERLRGELKKKNTECPIICMFCGGDIPRDEDIEKQREILTHHALAVCEQHPARQLIIEKLAAESALAKAREALNLAADRFSLAYDTEEIIACDIWAKEARGAALGERDSKEGLGGK